jgi:hypothetical protein
VVYLWNNKSRGAYGRESSEALENARMGYSILSARGFTLPAFCAVWGNVEAESGYNPWRWQSDVVLPYGDDRINRQNGHAYGLVQWDPANKYINGGASYSGYGPNYSDRTGSANEGTAQLNFLDATAVSSGQYFPNPNYNYQISYNNFKAATLDQYSIAWLTRAWFHNYERGTWSDSRTTAAQYWYDTLSGEPPAPTPGNIPIWLLFKIKERNSL